MTRLYRNKDNNKRRPINIVRQDKLTREFRKRGGIVWQDNEAEGYLKLLKAAAMNLNADTIVLQKKATVSEVLEELYHAKQWREGRLVDDPISKIKAEIEAQHYLLSVKKKYSIPRSETEQTKENLEYWRRELKSMKIKMVTQSPVGTIISFETDIPEHSLGSYVTADGFALHKIKGVPLEITTDILVETTDDFKIGQEVEFLKKI